MNGERGLLSAARAAANSRSDDRRIICRGEVRGKTFIYVEVHDKANTGATGI